MNTLHMLRRGRQLSFSQLTELTGISMRRLAEHEYEGRPLLPAEEELLAALFGVQRHSLATASATVLLERPALQSQQVYLLGAVAASTALVFALHVEQPFLPSARLAPNNLPILAERSTPTPSTTLEPQATPISADEAEALLVSLLGITPTPAVMLQAGLPATPSPTLEPAQPYLCPIVPEAGTVVVLGNTGAAGDGQPGVALAVDGDGDGYAEPGSTWHATIIAAHTGVVEVMRDSWPGGNQVVVEARDGWRSVYTHLDSVAVKTGQHVRAGQPLGMAGNTGRAAGPQLGLEIRHNGRVVDAAALLSCAS